MNKEELKNEILLCGRDPVYFIKRYVKIRHPVKGVIPFSPLFDYQEQLVRDYQSERFNIILKARQLGISEITAAYACWRMLFRRDQNILVMATKSETAKNIIKKVALALKKLPQWLLLADITTDNKLSIELNNGSQIKAIATSDDAGRSEALSLLIIDEAAFIKGLDELWTGLLPTVTAGGKVIVLSTPNGVGNKFHQLYTESEQGVNEFKSTMLMWWRHPERIADLMDDPNRPGFKTSSWYRNEIKSANMSDRDVAQELECNFLSSGDNVISSENLAWIEKGTYEPISKEWWDRNLFTWFEPEKDERYMITCDVARGDGADYSSAIVWKISDMSQVAEYYGKIPPDEFARLNCELGRKYNNAILVVENNNVGLSCLEHIKLDEYPSVYYSRKGDSKPGEIINTVWGKPADDLVPGFSTTPKTRPLIIAKLDEYIRNKSLNIRSKRFLYEAKTFIWMNGRPEAMRGRNDDLIMAAAFGAWIKDTFLAPNQSSIKVQTELINGISIFTTNNTQIAGASKNPQHVPQRIFSAMGRPQRTPQQIVLPGGRVEDFTWLISSG